MMNPRCRLGLTAVRSPVSDLEVLHCRFARPSLFSLRSTFARPPLTNSIHQCFMQNPALLPAHRGEPAVEWPSLSSAFKSAIEKIPPNFHNSAPISVGLAHRTSNGRP